MWKTKIFINLPVTDLAKATAFYEAIWFTKNPQFSDDNASGLSYQDDFYVMLLTHGFTKTFLPEHKNIADAHATCEVLNAFQLESREEVDALFEKVLLAGGKEVKPAVDHGFMYAHDFEDLDGHIWEPFWMDFTQAPVIPQG